MNQIHVNETNVTYYVIAVLMQIILNYMAIVQ